MLSETEQRALRCLIAAESVPGSPLPDHCLLEKLAVLIPCDTLAVAVTDTRGYVLDAVGLPRPHQGNHDLAVDAVVLSFRNGPDLLVQLAMDRHGRPFTDRDLALLSLLEPVCARLFRERPAPHLPPELTDQERRVLRLVAAGRTNAEVAERLSIAPSTVRKHLEHIYPKLGVTNRFAAAQTFESHPVPAPARATGAERYAEPRISTPH